MEQLMLIKGGYLMKENSVDDIEKMMRKKFGNSYGYYSSVSSVNSAKSRLFGGNPSLNCSDHINDEAINRLKGKYVRENIARKATPEEVEWMKKQPDISQEELEMLRPALEWLNKYVFKEEDDIVEE